MSISDLIVSVAVLLLCSATVVSVLAAALSFGLRQRLQRLAPRVRLPVLALLLITPFFGTLLLAVWGSAPGRWAYADDHCTGHATSHSSACVWHLPQVYDPFLQAILLTGLLILALLTARRMLRLWRGLHQLEALKRLALFDTTLGVWRLSVGLPMAFTSGLWRPACVISEGLLQQLEAVEVAQVCAHEQAHARRRDGLRQWILRFLSWGHLPFVRKRLLKDWELACEQACDEAVAQHANGRLVLAQTLLRVARLQLDNNNTLPAICRLTGGDLECRVLALLHPTRHRPMTALLLTSTAALIMIAALGGLAPWLHYWLEWV